MLRLGPTYYKALRSFLQHGLELPSNPRLYDEADKLLGEYDTATGKPAREIIYHNGIPVAVLSYRVTGTAPNQVWSTEVGYVFTDHLNTPRVIARASDNKVVWRWDDADLFGVAPPNENPSGLGTFTFNMRMPGQYYDRATNLFCNYFRKYDPRTGRYVQSDPIGLAGGINTYSYALGNPIRYTDPSGRFVPLVIAGVCAAGGCETLFAAAAGGAVWWGLNHNKLKGPIRNDSEGEKVCPPRRDFDWNDAAVPPKGPDGTEWPWRGPDAPGGPRGGYVNPSNPDQSAHPDLNHPAPVGPHWDFTDRKTGGCRIYPYGSVRPK